MRVSRTIWVWGDQLSRDVGPLRTAEPARDTVLMVTSRAKLAASPWHRQRLHIVLSGMAHFAEELRTAGFTVDERLSETFERGLAEHVAEHAPDEVVAMQPASRAARVLMQRLGVEQLPNDQFLTTEAEFAAWAGSRRTRLTMEDFYRWQRRRLDVLMDGDEPATGTWNYDHANRAPMPRGMSWPAPQTWSLDSIDEFVSAQIELLAPNAVGAPPDGVWPRTRAQAHERLDRFVSKVLPRFGPHEDAITSTNWHLAHSLLSSSINVGLLHPREVVAAAERAYREGRVGIESAEGFIRQIIGWREYVWGLYWLWGPEYAVLNTLDAQRPVPPAFTGAAATSMACVARCRADLDAHGYNHHIQRLMVFGNLALTAGVSPQAMTRFMWEHYVDGAEWVMVPNVVGMSLHADGGRMATKPYASGGAYIKKMSDYCRTCTYDPGKRVGENACPFTTLYWDFLARHEDRFRRNGRMAQQVAGMRRLSDLPAVRARAVEVLDRLDKGTL